MYPLKSTNRERYLTVSHFILALESRLYIRPVSELDGLNCQGISTVKNHSSIKHIYHSVFDNQGTGNLQSFGHFLNIRTSKALFQMCSCFHIYLIRIYSVFIII